MKVKIEVMVGLQLGFYDYGQTTSKKRNKKEKFLAEMDQVVLTAFA